MGHEQYTCADCGRTPKAGCVNSKWLAECPECGPADEPYLWTGGETLAEAVEHWSNLQNPMRFARVKLLREMQGYGWVANINDWLDDGTAPKAKAFVGHYMTLPCQLHHVSTVDSTDDQCAAIHKLQDSAESDPVEYAYEVISGYHDDTHGEPQGADEGVSQVMAQLGVIHKLDIERIATLNRRVAVLEARELATQARFASDLQGVIDRAEERRAADVAMEKRYSASLRDAVDQAMGVAS